MEKPMVLWKKKLWYYTENYETSMYKGEKKRCRLPRTKNFFIYNGKT